MYITVESHNDAFLSKISANFQSNTIMNFADLSKLTVQTKTFSSSDANKK